MKELLEYTTFAWRCFYYSWDFTSAIHNAAKCTGNRRLAMVLTGAFAGAMYGCTYNLIKQKFKAEDNPWPEMIGLPPKVVKSYGDVIQEMSKDAYSNRFFLPSRARLRSLVRSRCPVSPLNSTSPKFPKVHTVLRAQARRNCPKRNILGIFHSDCPN